MEMISSNQTLSATKSVFPEKLWLKTVLLLSAFAFVYFDTMRSFVTTWSGRDDYSHGFLVPFISLYFVYADKERLEQIRIKPNVIGGSILFGAGIMMLLLGRIGSATMVQQISIIIVIPGLILFLLGVQYLKALALPLGYLVFMIPPILDAAIAKLHWPCQLFSATLAAGLLNGIHIPVYRILNVLELPNVTLEVANECSGVRYLIAIIAIAIPLAIFTQKKLLPRLLLIIVALLIGIITNPLRITLIGVWAYKHGSETLHGPGHIYQGFFVSMVGFIALFILAFLAKKIHFKNPPDAIPNEKILAPGNSADVKRFNKAWSTALSVLLCLAGYFYLGTANPVSLRSPLQALPLVIGEWKGEDAHYPDGFYVIDKADSELYRIYRDSAGHEIKLYVAYCETQSQDKKIINYKLQKLYDDVEEVDLPLASRDPIRINKTVVNNHAAESLIYYWFDLDGRIIANRYKAKYITAIDGLIRFRTNGAMIMLMTDINKPENRDEIMMRAQEFAKEMLPLLQISLPREQSGSV
jgi:EpsI family protein